MTGARELEISDDKHSGLLTSVKENAEIRDWEFDSNTAKHALGSLAENLLVSWVKRNKEKILDPYIQDEKLRILVGRPGEDGTCDLGHGTVFNNIRCDCFFLIDQPSVGRSFVMFEAKFGNARINHNQAQYYREAYHRPWNIVPEAEEGHVIMAKCFDLDLEARWLSFYVGELIVPDEDPLEQQ